MDALAGLIESARRAAGGPLDDPQAEGARILGICNSCRYCEGYCGVFPALERRVSYTPADLDYLANLCHQCGACYYACQYAPPHEFGVNVPRTLAVLRRDSYVNHAWPRPLARLYRNHSVVVALAVALGIAAFLMLGAALAGSAALADAHADRGSYYAVIPHSWMAAVFGAGFAFAALAIGIAARRFWRGIQVPGPNAAPASAAASASAAHDALTLRYLGGGGDGCYVKSGIDHPPGTAKRVLHHFLFYGFLLCFAATSVATLYHYGFGWIAPYGYFSLPSLLGTSGGLGMTMGAAGLLWLRRQRDPLVSDPTQAPLDAGLLHLLLWTAVTGLLLHALRGTALMPVTLAVHLGFVLALFVLAPYGKFVHGVYRALALLKHARERRTPNPVAFSDS
jgi:citrate/tricarballylate utilization protein